VSDDLILRSEARSVLDEAHITCTCSGTLGFKKAISSGKFDAVLLDIPSAQKTTQAIETVRTGKVNRYSIILAMTSESESESDTLGAGANFAIQRSTCGRDGLKKAIQSAHALILRERRRYERHPVSISVELLCHGRSVIARMLDISEQGACLECPFPISASSLQLSFFLPGVIPPLKMAGVLAWTREHKAGIQFTSFTDLSHRRLSEWLTNRLNQG
jgi:hypothetical protein